MTEATPAEEPDPLIDEVRRIRAEIDAMFPNDLAGHIEYTHKVAAEVMKEMAEIRARQKTAEEKSPH